MDQDLDVRIAELEARTARTEQRMRRRTRWAAFAVGLALVIAAAPMVALAAATFADVPEGAPFYFDIENVAGAGIASGCGNGNYCPTQSVTRGQMAAFLARTGGRIGWADTAASAVQVPLLANGVTVVGAVTIKAGNVTGGQAFVHIVAQLTAQTSDTTASNYPYIVSYNIREQGSITYVGENWSYLMLAAKPASYSAIATTAINAVITVPTGVTKTYEIVVDRDAGGAASISTWMHASVSYYPFSENGDKFLNVIAGQPAGEPANVKP